MAKLKETNWDDLRVVLAIQEAKTVRGAASQIGTHHSTVSRRLEAIEQALGTRLFDRNPDGYFLTSEGEDVAKTAREIFKDISDLERRVGDHDGEIRGRVKITLPLIIAETAIAPALPAFIETYPNLQLDLITSYDLFDIERHEADVAIRLDNNPPDMLVGKRLFPYSQCAYGTPEYIERVLAGEDHENLRWINFSDDTSRFPEWTRSTPLPKVPSWGYVPDVRAQAELAKQNVGMAYLPCLIGDCDPALVRLPKATPVESRMIWVLTHPDLRRTARVKATMAFAEKAIRAIGPQIRGELAGG